MGKHSSGVMGGAKVSSCFSCCGLYLGLVVQFIWGTIILAGASDIRDSQFCHANQFWGVMLGTVALTGITIVVVPCWFHYLSFYIEEPGDSYKAFLLEGNYNRPFLYPWLAWPAWWLVACIWSGNLWAKLDDTVEGDESCRDWLKSDSDHSQLFWLWQIVTVIQFIFEFAFIVLCCILLRNSDCSGRGNKSEPVRTAESGLGAPTVGWFGEQNYVRLDESTTQPRKQSEAVRIHLQQREERKAELARERATREGAI